MDLKEPLSFEKQIEKSGRSKKLEALEGSIQKNIDPSFIGQNKIKRFKNGILANQNEETIKKLIHIIEKEETKHWLIQCFLWGNF